MAIREVIMWRFADKNPESDSFLTLHRGPSAKALFRAGCPMVLKKWCRFFFTFPKKIHLKRLFYSVKEKLREVIIILLSSLFAFIVLTLVKEKDL